MNTSIKIAFAAVMLTGFGSVQAKALEPGQCTPWTSVLGGACKVRKCAVGESPAIRIEPETVCPPRRAGIPTPVPPVNRRGIVTGATGGSTAPK